MTETAPFRTDDPVRSHVRVVAGFAYRHLLHGKRGDPVITAPQYQSPEVRSGYARLIKRDLVVSPIRETSRARTLMGSYLLCHSNLPPLRKYSVISGEFKQTTQKFHRGFERWR